MCSGQTDLLGSRLTRHQTPSRDWLNHLLGWGGWHAESCSHPVEIFMEIGSEPCPGWHPHPIWKCYESYARWQEALTDSLGGRATERWACGGEMSEMINSLNPRLGDYHVHHSKHLEQMFRNEADLGTWRIQVGRGGGGMGGGGKQGLWTCTLPKEYRFFISGWSPEGSVKEEGFFFFSLFLSLQ